MFYSSIILNLCGLISTSFLEVESNFMKPKLERNNILNKGLWVRNKIPKTSSNSFIFRANSLDADNMLQSNFDLFSDNFMQNGPVLSSYVERNKRSAYNKKQKRRRDNVKKCNDAKCAKDHTEEGHKPDVIIDKLKPSVFNDYPYDVSDILNSEHKYDDNNEINQDLNKMDINEVLKTRPDGLKQKKLDNQELTTISSNTTNYTSINAKRSMSETKDYETRLIKKLEFVEPINKTDNDINKLDRSVFDREKDVVWHQTAPIDVNVYKVLPKTDDSIRYKPISERGLIKVLSMLTKTFKKIMKQHNDIKDIHKQLRSMNEDFVKNVNALNKQFTDFDAKYSEILKVNTELKKMEEKLKTKEQYFNQKEKEFSKNLIDFENQQRKFLAQQKQFYSVQKLMLEQNEKINLKQNIIAKTQSEISHRQNNFARILKKAKQIYTNMKIPQGVLNSGIKPKTFKPKQESNESPTSTVRPTARPIKINLLNIPEDTPIQNYDRLILDEKDYQNIDELIYKYYFNNTFIDDIMRTKILASFGNSEKRNALIKKNKRNEATDKKTTILLPVNKNEMNKDLKNLQRERRWIKHSKKNSKRKLLKTIPTTTTKPDLKNIEMKGKMDAVKPNPFIVMATSFCNELGHNSNTQILSWCIEKALRRLQIMVADKSKDDIKKRIKNEVVQPTTPSIKIDLQTHTPTEETSKPQPPKTVVTENSNIVMFFPDNDELESNLKQYELIPDNEGTVYFDRSLHSSDIAKLTNFGDSEGFSDIMPGLDSNSRVEVDPRAFDFQARRRANVQRINERIMKMKMVRR
ncbi:GRIP and coiled-coil domain-containing protein-like isoform X2 [Colias croceus]|uniref:GRIP and coiled-coil domain-containing protein-like isoform X2 n=1 Tax=Colias crocea TaxID=72248 RepID=UPI001E280175|nr:GRIP and coiled-coil domain-containing protein-like isoform X2 [Colias croceus]